jgi:hypothetical protein
MFRCFSLLGVVAVALGVAAFASVCPAAPKKLLPPGTNDPTPKPSPRAATFVRVPGLAFHARLSAN